MTDALRRGPQQATAPAPGTRPRDAGRHDPDGNPSTFTLAAGQTQSLNITANVAGLPVNTYAFGYVVLTQGASAGDVVHLTVVVRPVAPRIINVTPASLAATQKTDTNTSQTLTIGNTGTAPLTWSIGEAPGTMRVELAIKGRPRPTRPSRWSLTTAWARTPSA